MTEIEKPPYSNTGVQNTCESGLRSLVDWVSFTLKTNQLEQVFEVLKMPKDEFIESSGKLGYKESLRHGHIVIYFNGNENMGIHVEMSGQGCREYENYLSSWQLLFTSVFLAKGHFTRVDIAIDDFRGYFTLDKLVKKLKKGEVRSIFKKARNIETIRLEDGESQGRTIYYGSPSASIQIRMYEKNHERENKGYQLEEGLDFWNRTEIQARDERAMAIAFLIYENSNKIGEYVLGILKHYISFVDKSKDTNKARWKVSKFWLKFLGDVEPLKLTNVAPDRTIEKIENWIEKQVEPSLAMLFTAYGSIDKIVDLVNNGLERLKEKDLDIVESYRSKQLIDRTQKTIRIDQYKEKIKKERTLVGSLN